MREDDVSPRSPEIDPEDQQVRFADEVQPKVKAEIAEDTRGDVDELAPISRLLDDIRRADADAGDEACWTGRLEWSRAFHKKAKIVEAQWLATLSTADRKKLRTHDDVTVYAWDAADTGEQPTCAQQRRYHRPETPPPPADPNCPHDWQAWPEGIAVRQPTARPTGYSGSAYQTAGVHYCPGCGAYGYLDLKTGAIVPTDDHVRDHREQTMHIKSSQRCISVDKMTDRDLAVRYDAGGNPASTVCLWDEIVDESQLDEWSLVKAVTVAVQAIGVPRRHQQYRRGVRNGTIARYSQPTDRELEALIGTSRQAARRMFKASGVHKDQLIAVMKQKDITPDVLYMILNARFPNITKVLMQSRERVTQPSKTLLLKGAMLTHNKTTGTK